MSITNIEWTATPHPVTGELLDGMTWNPWIGCTRVSEGCQNCYAESWASRHKLDVWGQDKDRHLTSVAYWRQPFKWNRLAQAEGVHLKVFCASLADVFDAAVPQEWRDRVFEIIKATPHLDWLLLTKRPENWDAMLPWRSLNDAWPNVWLGCTVENQRRANERMPLVAEVPAVVRFLSLEPLLTPVVLTPWLPTAADWLILGGESSQAGRPARPCDTDWIEDLIDQGRAADVPAFVKQLGSNVLRHGSACPKLTRKANNPDEWDESLRVRQFPEPAGLVDRAALAAMRPSQCRVRRLQSAHDAAGDARGGPAQDFLMHTTLTPLPTISRAATISPCGMYRYRLTRTWNLDQPVAYWIMLNPSVADATVDDATIRRCIGFARQWGCGGIDVRNLFAFRATDPRKMLAATNPVGPDNDAHYLQTLAGRWPGPVVAAWGAHGVLQDRARVVLELLQDGGVSLRCLGVTQTGQPKHPLRLAYSTSLVPYPLGSEAQA